MGKKNKFKKDEAGAGGDGKGAAPPAGQPGPSNTQQQQQPQQQAPKKENKGPGGDGRAQQPSQQPKGQGQQQQGSWGGAATQQQQTQQSAGAWGGQQQSRGPPQGGQQQRSGPPQGGQQQSRGPPQGGQQQRSGPPQGGQQQRSGPPQGGQQQGSGPNQGGQQQWRGPPQGGQQQGSGPPQGGHQQGRGPPHGGQQQSRGPPHGGQQQSRGPPQGGQQQRSDPRQQDQGRQYQQQQQSRGPPPQQQQQQYQQRQQPTGSQTTSTRSSSSSSSQIAVSSKSGVPRGTAGVRGSVETNYLRMNLDKMPSVAYHYDVQIDPERPKKFMRPAFQQFCSQFFNNFAIAFDGRKSCYTVQRLPLPDGGVEHEVEIADTSNRTIKFKVALKETNDMEVDLDSLKRYFNERIYDKPMRALQCLEVVLANPCHGRGIRVGRSFFMEPKQKKDLKDGYEMFLGLYQAAILGDQPFLNVDISHKSFPSACWLTEYLENNRKDIRYTLDYRGRNDLKAYLRGINVEYHPPKCFGAAPRTYKVNDVSELGADKLRFRLEDGTEMTVAQYFASKGYSLKYPQLNCLHVGSTVKNNFIPIELIRIPAGQATNKKDGPKQVQEMIRFAATSTDERKRKIMEMLNYFNHNADSTVRNFGIQIEGRFIEVPMRLLSSPFMEYLNRETIRIQSGAWRMNEGRTQFLITAKDNHKWAVIYSSRSRINYNTVMRLAEMISSLGRKLNMNLADKPNIKTFDKIDFTLQDFRKDNYDLVVVLLPYGGTTYADIKQSAELKHGILTQCIKEETVERRLNPQTIQNLLLKINAKLNGTNHKIEDKSHVPLKNVMFLGADVTHPSPDQREIPSVVGVAASHDANGACYNMQYRLQRSTVENIEEMESICSYHLKMYFKYQKRYPEHIIYYRDGVSDGQFPIVKQNELRGIRAACSKMRIQSVKLTCIIVVKRHHTRFFPPAQTREDRFNKFNNVSPGTVVDQVIVHPNEKQFFMVSHQSIQGTAKPTRYNVIEDDANMNIDDLQKLTYNMCHLFPRCNRVVSYPAPAYLAHLVAFRGRVYLEGQNRFQNLQQEYNRRIVNDGFMQRNPMYFV